MIIINQYIYIVLMDLQYDSRVRCTGPKSGFSIHLLVHMCRRIYGFCDWMESYLGICDWYLYIHLVINCFIKRNEPIHTATASVARSYSNYLDFLVEERIQNFLKQYLQLSSSKWFSSYPDLFAFTLTMLLTIMLVIGVKESTRFNTIFTGVNILVIIFCVVVGLFNVDIQNWKLTIDQLPENENVGDGGFFPFGFKGMISGAATCFYSYVGFDTIATTGEEVVNPQRDIPISIILALTIVSLAYCMVSIVQTMMWPYWDQNQKAPLPYVFEKIGLSYAKYVITVGALAGLSTSLLGSMFPLPRILYAMSSDGLLFRSFANIHPRFKTPVLATIVSGLFSALMATFFDVDQLAEMMSIGTLLAYSLVAISIIILRYKKVDDEHDTPIYTIKNDSFVSKVFNCRSRSIPNKFSSVFSLYLIFLLCKFKHKHINVKNLNFLLIFYLLGTFIISFNICMFQYEDQLYSLQIPLWIAIIMILLVVAVILCYIILIRQPMIITSKSFKVTKPSQMYR